MANTPTAKFGAPSKRGLLLGLLLAVFGGATMPLQSRINGALGLEMGSPVGAALISFIGGLALLILMCLLVAPYRKAALKIVPVLRERRFPWWYLIAGAVGASTIISQAVAVPLVGVALFTVCLVTGQTIGSLLVDRVGFALGVRRRISPLRLLGAILTIAGVLWAASPRLSVDSSVLQLLPALLFAIFIGTAMGFQAASNGVQAREFGSPVAATLVNFTVGTIMLAVSFALLRPAELGLADLPGQWWYYIGGIFGVCFVVISSLLVRYLGVLLTGLGMIGGQLVGSLLLDMFFPSAGTLLHPATVAGTILTLLAIALASISGSRSGPRRPTTS